MIQINQLPFSIEITGSDARLRSIEGTESVSFGESLNQARENDRHESTSAEHLTTDVAMLNANELAGQMSLADRAAAQMAGAEDTAEDASMEQGKASDSESNTRRTRTGESPVASNPTMRDASLEAEESAESAVDSKSAQGRNGERLGEEAQPRHGATGVHERRNASESNQARHTSGVRSDVAGPSAAQPQVSATKGVTTSSKTEGVGAVTGMNSFREAMSRVGAKAGSPQILRAETQVAAQASRIMVQGLRDGKTEVVMRLCPEALGPVKIELSVDEGRVSAKMHAEHDAARELLSAGLDHLRGTLEARGLNVDRLEVVTPAEPGEHGLMSGGFEGADRHGASNGQDAAGGDAGRGSGVDDGAATESRVVEPAAESAGMWWERGTDGLALLRLDAVV